MAKIKLATQSNLTAAVATAKGEAVSDAKDYTDSKAVTTLADAKEYTDLETAIAYSNAESYADGVLVDAKAYTDTRPGVTLIKTGPGRPDVPAGTGGTITGSEPVGCEYRSTDGAGVGAWTWLKTTAGWSVTFGTETDNWLKKDPTTGEYFAADLQRFLEKYRDGLLYGIQVPKGLATACVKTESNAGIPVPVPGHIGQPAVDAYIGRGPFFTVEVNGFVDTDGYPHVTAIQGDDNFSRTGSSDVWVLAPVLWWKQIEETDSMSFVVCDSYRPGLGLQPKAKLPTGKLRPFMLYAKYPLSIDGSGNARSVSGAAPQVRNVSHNSLITQCKNGTSGYSGKSFADDWYVKVMFLLKYATKNSQSVFGGTSNFDLQYRPAVAETDVTRVVLTTTQANNFPIGSSVLVGTGPGRNDATSHDVANTTVLSIEDLGGGQSALNLNVSAPITTTTDLYVSSWHWRSGACDQVQGDGSPSNPVATNQPFTLQGIELMHGMYETLGDVIFANTGDGWRPRLLPDSRKAASSVTSDYVDSDVNVPATNDTWQYSLYPRSAGGLLFGDSVGGSSSTGMCDGTYVSSLSTVATRQWRCLGSLAYGGGRAGLWFVAGYDALGVGGWRVGSRLSANGRSM